MDETYQNYVNRVAPLTLSATHKTQLQNIQTSPKFEGGVAVSFPGYTIITPPWEEDSGNDQFYNYLKTWQLQLSQQLDEGLMVPLPPESFHLTIADLIWHNSYSEAVKENPLFEDRLRQRIGESFQKSQIDRGNPIIWQLLGISIFPRAIAVCLVPKDEESYKPIVQLRRSIYQNYDLIGLGIEQQYDFTAHITLGYFGKILPDLDRDRLVKILSDLNDQSLLCEQPQVFTIQRAQLRKFDDMTRYYRELDWPVLSFC